MALISAGLTDIGQKRKTNQDSIYTNSNENLFIVADGMGGHNGGDIASLLAVNSIPEYIYNNSELTPKAVARNAIKHTNKLIFNQSQADPKLKGMGTTVVSLYFRNNTAYVSNVGDSRAYLVNKRSIFQLTKDHSLVQEKINLGIYTREDAAKDPMKNVLVRTVGYEDELDVDVFTYKVNKNDILLICSDGLHGRVSDEDINYIINTYIPDPSNATQKAVTQVVETLIKQANMNGGNDNISVIVVLAQ